MITETPLVIEYLTDNSAAKQQQSWNQVLASATKTVEALLVEVAVPLSELNLRQQACVEFPLLVPQPFINKIEKGNALDPLLLQVLPQSAELEEAPGFIDVPLAEKHSNLQKGLIHKYHGRVLVLLSTGCAVNCRYCFRRHFPYQENRMNKNDWQATLDYVAQDPSIEELILSGGDPLMLNDQQIEKFISQAEQIPHLQRLRIHSRLPVVIPQRITKNLVKTLQACRFDCALVLHINHAREIDSVLISHLNTLKQAGITLLNQAVLLRGVNDSVAAQTDLSKRLFHAGVLPYYLHLLDKVKGAHHFEVSESAAIKLHHQLVSTLSGFLVPKLVKEEAGKKSKTPVPVMHLLPLKAGD